MNPGRAEFGARKFGPGPGPDRTPCFLARIQWSAHQGFGESIIPKAGATFINLINPASRAQCEAIIYTWLLGCDLFLEVHNAG